jgi:hypothetical protein
MSTSSPPGLRDDSNTSSYIGLAVGAAFLVAVLVLIIKRQPDAGSPEFWLYRIIAALGSAGVATALPGVLKLEWKWGVKAGGALAVFVLVYSINPPSLAQKNPSNPQDNVVPQPTPAPEPTANKVASPSNQESSKTGPRPKDKLGENYISPEKAVEYKDQNVVKRVCGNGATLVPRGPGRRTFVNFGKPYPNQVFTIVLFVPPSVTFTPTDYVCATGIITDYEGKPQIELSDPNKLEVVR